jgi:DNA-binding LacI/PurR family transcriptional regulator
MPVTMRDVARRAGVSLATVSYVVNGGPRHVSEELRQRVEVAMGELAYRRASRGRSRTRPLTFGVIVPDTGNSFFSRAISGLRSVLRPGGHVLVAGSSDERPDWEDELVSACVKARVDGLVVTPCGRVPESVERLAAARLPVVLMDRDAGPTNLSRVVMDNYRSAFQATRLLIESGHRRIALVNGSESVVTARERLRGYRDALAFAGIEPDDARVRGVPFTHEEGRLATLDLLSQARRPEAIFSSSVILTSGVLRALQERGLRWPDDIALVGYGDADWASLVTPPLTVIQQPAQQLGVVAGQLLLAGAGSGQHVVLESHLVLRESHWRVPGP